MITTFYSYKGGVGRSFLALETAMRLASRGASVVVWDLDLEAPGLQRNPALVAVEEDTKTPGFSGTLDLIERQLREPEPLDVDAIRAALVPFEHPRLEGDLSFLLPAPLEDRYAERFASIEWAKLFGPGDKPGVAILHRIGRLLQEELEYDHVIVDARTGFTDLAAATTLLLPDTVVVVYTLASQGLDPVSTVTKRLVDLDIPYRRVLNLVPDDERLNDEERQTLAVRRAQLDALNLRPHVEVAYRPGRVLAESLPTLAKEREDEKALASLSGWIEEQARILRRRDEVEHEDRRSRYLDTRDRRAIHERAKTFEQEVGELFSLAGYKVDVSYELRSGQFDLRLRRPGELMDEQVLVECKDEQRRMGKDDVLKFARMVEDARRDDQVPYRALMVNRNGFGGRALEVARSNFVELRTVDDVLRSLADVSPMVDAVVRGYEGSALERLWVEPDVGMDGGRPEPATERLEAWLREPGSPVLALLGDFGTGKTSLARHWAHLLARRHRAEGLPARAPYFVDLRGSGSRQLTLEGVLDTAYRKVTGQGLRVPGLLRRNREGHLVLIFDGFDEMLAYLDPTLTREVLRQLLTAAEGGAKVLLTCRTHFFRDQPDEQEHLGGESALASLSATGLWHELKDVPGSQVAYLLPFTSEQIDRYLKLAAPPPQDWQDLRRRLTSTYGLEQLATQPFLLDLIVRSLGELGLRDEVTITDLYEVYAAGWLDRNSPRFQILREPAQRWKVVEAFARTLWGEPGAEMHYERIGDIAAEVLSWDRPLGPAERLQLDAEIRTATFLNRDPDGMYRFMHRSFLEFFVARSMRQGLRDGDPGCLDLARLTSPVARFLDGFEDRGQVDALVRAVLAEPYRRRVSENALQLAYWRGLTDATTGAQLEGAELSGLGLQKVVLSNARLAGAGLQGTTMRLALLDGADLTGARVRQAELREADLSGARLRDADMSYADLAHARLDEADLEGADLTRTNLAHSSLQAVRWEGARLWGTGLLGAGPPPPVALTSTTGAVVPTALRAQSSNGHSGAVLGVASVVVDGRVLVVTGSDDGSARLWDAVSGEPVLTLSGHDGAVSGVASVVVDGRVLVATGSVDGSARLWDAVSGEPVLTLAGHEGPVWGVASVVVDGRVLVATGSRDGTARLWDAVSGEPVLTLSGHDGAVSGVASVVVDGRVLVATASWDGTARLWDAITGEQELVAYHTPDGGLVAVDSNLKVSGDEDSFRWIKFADNYALYDVRDVPGALDEGALVWLERERAAQPHE